MEPLAQQANDDNSLLGTLQTTNHPIAPTPLTMRNNGDYLHNGTYQQRQPYQAAHIASHNYAQGVGLQDWIDNADPGYAASRVALNADYGNSQDNGTGM
jgi:hypothetical protein